MTRKLHTTTLTILLCLPGTINAMNDDNTHPPATLRNEIATLAQELHVLTIRDDAPPASLQDIRAQLAAKQSRINEIVKAQEELDL